MGAKQPGYCSLKKSYQPPITKGDNKLYVTGFITNGTSAYAKTVRQSGSYVTITLSLLMVLNSFEHDKHTSLIYPAFIPPLLFT